MTGDFTDVNPGASGDGSPIAVMTPHFWPFFDFCLLVGSTLLALGNVGVGSPAGLAVLALTGLTTGGLALIMSRGRLASHALPDRRPSRCDRRRPLGSSLTCTTS